MLFGRRSNPSFLRALPVLMGTASNARRAADASLFLPDKSLKPLSTCSEPASSGRPSLVGSAAPAPFTNAFRNGSRQAFSPGSGKRVLLNTTACTGLPGNGKASMEPWLKPLWRKNASDPIRPAGEKSGQKRSLLTDGNGVPLSLAVAGANRHDSWLLAPTLDSLVVPRPDSVETAQNLCADAGYEGKPCMGVVEERNDKP